MKLDIYKNESERKDPLNKEGNFGSGIHRDGEYGHRVATGNCKACKFAALYIFVILTKHVILMKS